MGSWQSASRCVSNGGELDRGSTAFEACFSDRKKITDHPLTFGPSTRIYQDMGATKTGYGVRVSGSRLGAGGVRYGVYARDHFACVYCGATRTALTLDHVECQSSGGGHDSQNFVTACYSCNSSRQDRDDAAFYAELAEQGVDTNGLIGRVATAIVQPIDRALGRRLETAGKRARAASKRAGGSTMGGHVAAARAARREFEKL